MYRRILAILIVVLSFSALAYAADDEVGATFAKTSEYLNATKSSITTNATQGFENGYLLVKGEAGPRPDARTPGLRRIQAITAAKAVAYRELASVINGVAVAGETTVENLELSSDRIRTAVSGIIKGAVVVSEDYNDQEGIALVLVKIGMNGPGSLGDTLYKNLKSDPSMASAVATTAPKFAPPKAEVAAEKPAIIAAGYDGLIIDATSQSFRPALINRIYSPNGEVIYDPSKISQKVLVDQGCGEYTNSIDKAKAALGSRGVNNPLVVSAVKSVGNTDLQVSEKDGVDIFTANQKSPFLASAKVAFVLK
ncbi:MAG: LPP20 family lipoprotein [Nitrospirae bacterium]|nr:LPP20 family lipoprotein [Nitrospirota bacterium]